MLHLLTRSLSKIRFRLKNERKRERESQHVAIVSLKRSKRPDLDRITHPFPHGGCGARVLCASCRFRALSQTRRAAALYFLHPAVFLAARKLECPRTALSTGSSLFLPGGSLSSIVRDRSSKIRAVLSYGSLTADTSLTATFPRLVAPEHAVKLDATRAMARGRSAAKHRERSTFLPLPSLPPSPPPLEIGNGAGVKIRAPTGFNFPRIP